MMDELQYYDTPTRRNAKKSRKWIFIGFIILLVLILAVGSFTFFPSLKHKAPTPTSSPTPTDFIFPTDTPTPSGSLTPSPTSKSGAAGPTAKVTGKVTPTPIKSGPTPTTTSSTGLTVDVENGSGTVGAASKMATFLKSLGYTISSTGNADNYSYQGVTIELKKSDASDLSQLKKDVSASYTVTSATATLPDTSTTDAVVIVGQ